MKRFVIVALLAVVAAFVVAGCAGGQATHATEDASGDVTLHGLYANSEGNPSGPTVSVYFEYGPTTAYGHREASADLNPECSYLGPEYTLCWTYDDSVHTYRVVIPDEDIGDSWHFRLCAKATGVVPICVGDKVVRPPS